MVGVDFVDTVVVRQPVNKGTKSLGKSVKGLNWAGPKFKKYQKENQKLVKDIDITSSKGTRRINLDKLGETEIPSLQGHHITIGKGTGIRIG